MSTDRPAGRQEPPDVPAAATDGPMIPLPPPHAATVLSASAAIPGRRSDGTLVGDAAPDAGPGVIDPRVLRYVELLGTAGVERGLLGPREVERLWDRHLLNCAVVAPLLPRSSTVTDVGSGAGLPGVVLALLRPDLSVRLLEPLLRRATYLSEVVADLRLDDQVEVVRSRAEEYRGARSDVVVARAVAPLDRLAELATYLLPARPAEGTLLAVKGRRAHDEIREHTRALTRLGARWFDVVEVGAELDEPTTVVTVRMSGRRARPTG